MNNIANPFIVNECSKLSHDLCSPQILICRLHYGKMLVLKLHLISIIRYSFTFIMKYEIFQVVSYSIKAAFQHHKAENIFRLVSFVNTVAER